MKKYVIYEHISPSGKVYVGQTSDLSVRWEGGGHRYFAKNKKGQYIQAYFANALLKYGWNNFEHRIILEGVSKSEADYAEKYLIKWYKLHNMSYNITNGGDGGSGLTHTMSPEMRAYMSQYMRANSPLIGTHRTEKQKQSARKKMLGRKMSLEAREKMRVSHTGVPLPWNCREVYAFDKTTKELVKHYSSVTEAAQENKLCNSAICNAAVGRCPSAGSYIWSFTSTINPQDSLYNRMNYTKVYCYSLDGSLVNVYDSTREAANAVGGSINCISNCCTGRAHSHKGYMWKKELASVES